MRQRFMHNYKKPLYLLFGFGFFFCISKYRILSAQGINFAESKFIKVHCLCLKI